MCQILANNILDKDGGDESLGSHYIALTSSSNVGKQEIFDKPRCFSFICKLALTLATSDDLPEKYLLFFEMPRSLERPKNSDNIS